eukprot:3842248-Amphidinium_carterae.1
MPAPATMHFRLQSVSSGTGCARADIPMPRHQMKSNYRISALALNHRMCWHRCLGAHGGHTT